MPALGLIMLLIWPVVVAVLFNRMPRPQAAIWSILAGYLLLPPLLSIDLPAIPAIDKSTIPAMAAAFFAFITPARADEPEAISMAGPIVALFLMMLVAPILTAATNADALVDGIVFRPGVTITQGIGEMIVTVFRLLPFVLGYRFLSDSRGAVLLVRILVLSMLAYSLPMMIEVRLSPQINVWVYGFFQHDFSQTMRYGGFRPIVFLQHPLWVAFLTMSALIFALAMTRAERTKYWFGVTGYLGLMLILCKSLGVLLQLFVAGPILWLLRPRAVVGIAMLLGMAVMVYPAVRASGVLPVEQLADLATGAEAERGGSLAFRLANETILLDRALERGPFGWGAWGRPLIVNPETGRTETIIDGEWIRILGQAGIWGFLAEFLLLLTPLIMLWLSWPKGRGVKPGKEELALAAIALILGLNMVDLIPNATITPLTWLMAGTVAGAARRMAKGSYFVQDGVQELLVVPKKTGLKAVL